MGIWTSKGTDPEVKKGIKEILSDLENQKKSARIYLILGIIFSGLFGYVLGKFL